MAKRRNCLGRLKKRSVSPLAASRRLALGVGPGLKRHGRNSRQKKCTVPLAHDAEIYKERNHLERAINGLKQFRAVAVRFDKRAINYFATYCLIVTLTEL